MYRREKRYRRDYDDRYQYERPRRQERRGCLYSIERFFINVFTVIMVGALIIIGVILFVLIALNFSRILAFFTLVFSFLARIGPYVLYILGAIVAIYVLYWVVTLFAAISERISKARVEKARADLARNKVKQTSVGVQRERVKLEREKPPIDPYAKYRSTMEPRPTVKLTRELDQQGPYVRVLPQDHVIQPQEPESIIPGMPQRIFHYTKYQHLIKPGQLIIGGRSDGSIRIGTWADYKVVLILGGSSSGKTTTIVEKVLGSVLGGGQIVPCDPHAHKEDSLFRRIYPLEHALFPGAIFAVEHPDIMRNIEIVKKELDKRVHGGDCSIPVTLIIEELNRLQRDKNIARGVTEVLEIIGQEGRGYNVYAIVGAQQITGLSDIRKSVISFIVHRVDLAEAQLCIPARYAKYASELKVGQSFVKDADGRTEPLMQVLVSAMSVQEASLQIPKRRAQTGRFYARETTPIVHRPGRIEQSLPEPQVTPVLQNRGYQGPKRTRLTQANIQDLPQAREPTTRQSQSLPQTDDLTPRHGATWGDTGVIPQVKPQVASTEELRPRPVTTRPEPQVSIDPVKQSQNGIAQNKLDKLTQARKKRQ